MTELKERIGTREGMLRLVAFITMMQHGEGLVVKAPSYIEEKFLMCMQTNEKYLKHAMDDENKQRFRDWKKRWDGYI